MPPTTTCSFCQLRPPRAVRILSPPTRAAGVAHSAVALCETCLRSINRNIAIRQPETCGFCHGRAAAGRALHRCGSEALCGPCLADALLMLEGPPARPV